MENQNDRRILNDFIFSWATKEGRSDSTKDLLDWISECNSNTHVDIRKIQPEQAVQWALIPEEGIIANRQRTFFTIEGMQSGKVEQPILIQNEIGYLGILCKKIGGVIHMLMQAKIEPGNINKVQISPTIQATKSNFTQKHGGRKPAYLDYFLDASKYTIVVDQLQSEQAARFLGKRNRNIVILVPEEEEVEVLQTHRWMTLGQLKQLMRHDNIVNMDTRTVISCIPYYRADAVKTENYFTNRALYRSMFCEGGERLPDLYHSINNDRMFTEERKQRVPLHQLRTWEWKDGEFVCKTGYHFKVVFCDIQIEGREVVRWQQPLFEAVGMAVFGLLCAEKDGVLYFLVKARSEIGNFDGPELGPTVQLEADEKPENEIDKLFYHKWDRKEGLMFEGILSEEGGRFYHEQNQNVLIRIDYEDLSTLPGDYYWMTFRMLNQMVQHNNKLNIQLRNLLSLLEL